MLFKRWSMVRPKFQNRDPTRFEILLETRCAPGNAERSVHPRALSLQTNIGKISASIPPFSIDTNALYPTINTLRESRCLETDSDFPAEKKKNGRTVYSRQRHTLNLAVPHCGTSTRRVLRRPPLSARSLFRKPSPFQQIDPKPRAIQTFQIQPRKKPRHSSRSALFRFVPPKNYLRTHCGRRLVFVGGGGNMAAQHRGIFGGNCNAIGGRGGVLDM